ncbi:Type I restriction-modification system, specificity subunit S [Olavius sp. associated proteobacterium Delta 1]|nr:Type I restriction-modification system, specificity subunit S [Olavius sp. associated proteobacterium Delta 1]
MSKRNDNRPGYKKTKVGWIPKERGVGRLKDVCGKPVSGYSLKGGNRPAKQGEHGVLKLSCIQNGRFVPTENKFVKGNGVTKLRTPVRKGTLLVSRSNTDELVGAVCFVDRDFPYIYLSDLIWEVSGFNDSDPNFRWLTYLLCSDYYRAQIVARANGTSGSMKKITKPSFLGLSIPLPLVSEQKKIAEILSTWDTAIEQTRKLIDAKHRLKKALM